MRASVRADLDLREADLARAIAAAARRSRGGASRSACSTTSCRCRRDGRDADRSRARVERSAAGAAGDQSRRLRRSWLVAFLRDELIERRGITRAVIGLSGGVDSAVTAYLVRPCAGRRKRLRDSHAVQDVAAPEVSTTRSASIDALRRERAHDRDQLRPSTGICSSSRSADARRRGNVHGAHAHGRALRSIGKARCVADRAPATRPNGS